MRQPRLLAAHFAAGVQARRSLKAIERVAPGDWVWAWEPATRSMSRRRVKQVFQHGSRAVLNVICRNADGMEEAIQATPEHPFWVVGRGWVAARRLASGDVLQHARPAAGEWRVARVANADERADVYNFEVEGLHNYHVGSSGLLVHNDSGMPRFDPEGPPVHDHHPPDPHQQFLALLGAEERAATVRKVQRVASRAVAVASLGLAVHGIHGRVQKGLSDARARIELAEIQRTTPPSWAVDYEVQMQRAALQVQPLRLMAPPPHGPQLSLSTPLQRFYGELSRAETAEGMRLMQVDADRALVAAHPITLRDGGKLIPNGGLWGIRDRIDPLDTHDHSVVQAMVRLRLGEGDHRGARALADDAGLYLGDYNALFDQAYRPRVESTAMQAARLTWTDPVFQSDLADYGGRMIAASSFGNAPGMTGASGAPAQERGRMFVSSALQVSKAIVETVNIVRDGHAGYSDATTVSQVWADAALNLSGRAIANMGSEQSGTFLPSPTKGSIWSRPAMQYAGMWATDSALSAAGFVARDAFLHHVDPSRPSPFANGWSPAIVPDFAANASAYPIFHSSAQSGAFGSPQAAAIWKGSLLAGAREVGMLTWDALAQ